MAQVLFCCLFMNLESLNVKLRHSGECVSRSLQRLLELHLFWLYGVLNLHSTLEPVNLKAYLLLVCFISLDAGCGLMKG